MQGKWNVCGEVCRVSDLCVPGRWDVSRVGLMWVCPVVIGVLGGSFTVIIGVDKPVVEFRSL